MGLLFLCGIQDCMTDTFVISAAKKQKLYIYIYIYVVFVPRCGGCLLARHCVSACWHIVCCPLAHQGRVLGGGLPALALCTPSGKVMPVGY